MIAELSDHYTPPTLVDLPIQWQAVSDRGYHMATKIQLLMHAFTCAFVSLVGDLCAQPGMGFGVHTVWLLVQTMLEN